MWVLWVPAENRYRRLTGEGKGAPDVSGFGGVVSDRSNGLAVRAVMENASVPGARSRCTSELRTIADEILVDTRS
jgi:hypothetical protein